MATNLNSAAIEGAAQHLFAAALAGDKGAPLPKDLALPDLATAYLVQDRLQALWTEAGAGAVVGLAGRPRARGDRGDTAGVLRPGGRRSTRRFLG